MKVEELLKVINLFRSHSQDVLECLDAVERISGEASVIAESVRGIAVQAKTLVKKAESISKRMNE